MSFENESNSSVDSESGRKKYRAVIADVDIESQARDVAESRLLSSKEELKGFKGFFRKIWRHNLAHEYYRQKEIAKAKREIKESENLYVGEVGDIKDHECAMKAIVDRFQAEYENDCLLREGEEKRVLKDSNPEEAILKKNIQELIGRFAAGKISEEQFVQEKNVFLNLNMGSSHDSKVKKGIEKGAVFADNLLEIAKQVKGSIAHGKGIDSLDDDFEIIIGRARAGVETEASYNAVDRMLEKMKSNSVGKYVSRFVNETTMASAVAIAYGVIAKGAIGAAQRGARMVGPLGMGLSAGVGGAVAGLRENKRLKEERAQHMREMAKGGEMEANSKRREEMEKFRYETKNASELSKNLSEALEELKTQPSEQKLHAVLEKLNEINSRLSFSEREKIDLIDFSDSKNVEKERTDMYITAAEAKVFLKKNIHANWATFYNNEDQLDEYLQHIKDVKIQKDFLEEKTVKDAAFNKMKRKKVAWSVTKGLGIGLGVGVVAQEIGAYMEGGKEGIFEEATSGTKEHHYTSLEYLRRYISGELPKDELYSAPSGPSEVIHKETSSHEAIVGTKDYIKERENIFTKIKRGVWADNETLKPDKNELKVWWGGEKGTGIDENGNYVFSVKHMVKGGSFHGGKHFDPQELMKEGKMKLLISLSGDTQNQVVEIPIDANGNAIIDPNSEIGKIAFNNVDGHANFLGKFAEVVVTGEKIDGVEKVSVLATHVGKEIESVKTLIVEEKNIREMVPSSSKTFSRPADYDAELPFVIPIMGRRPMEQLKNGESVAKVPGTDLEDVEIQQEEPVEKEEEKVIVDEDDVAKKAAIVAATAAAAAMVSTPSIPPTPVFEPQQESTDHPTRAAAWHTINKLNSYADINAPTKDESDQKFLELTRNLWNELTIHGAVRKDAETGKWEMISRSDLDGESCLKLLEIAGIQIERSKINFVENGNSAESGLVLDTSNNHGVIAEEEGKRLIFDHHAEESDRDTSATKFLYETLVEMGLLEKKPYLDKYVEFVTSDDNKNFSDEECQKIFNNYHKNLFGLNRKLSIEQIMELIESGVDPMEKIPDDYLKSHFYKNPATGKKETLAELSKNMLKKVVLVKKEIEKMEKRGLVINTGKDKYGKVLLDVKTLKANGKYMPRVSGDAGGPIAAFAQGYDTYICWSPKENSFAIFTKKEMPRDFLPQGRNTRGNMWTKNGRDTQPLAVTLEEILSKLSGKPFVIEGGLKNAIEDTERKNLEQEEINAQEKEKQEKISQSAKRMGEWFSDLELSYENIREEAKKANFSIAELAMKFIQENVGLKAEYESRKVTIDEKDDKAVEKLALSVILESEKKKLEEKIKIGGENDILRMKLVDVGADLLEVKLGVFSNQSPVTPNIPPQSPPNISPSPEKLSADQLREAAGQIKTQFDIDVQTDQIAGEDNNWEIMNKLQGALSKIDKEKLSNIKTIGLHQSVSRVLSGEGAVALAYTLSPEEMAVKINELLGEMDRKKAEIFESNQFVKEVRAKSPELLNNFKRQMDEQKVSIKAQLNFLEIVEGAKLNDDMIKILQGSEIVFLQKEQSVYPEKIDTIGIDAFGKLEVYFGNDSDQESVATHAKDLRLCTYSL